MLLHILCLQYVHCSRLNCKSTLFLSKFNEINVRLHQRQICNILQVFFKESEKERESEKKSSKERDIYRNKDRDIEIERMEVGVGERESIASF